MAHDDRLDVLAMAVQYWVDQMASDADNQIQIRKDEMLEEHLQKFMDGFNIGGSSKQYEGWLN